MKQFEVQFKSFDTLEAETLEDAVNLFKAKYPHPHVEPTNFYEYGEECKNNKVFGCCEVCELPIFENDKFEYDSEGVMWHLKCYS